jgi:epoxyqueuosine reductase
MNAEVFAERPARELERLVATFVATSPENSMKNIPEEPAWDEPLVGFASGADPIFETYKEHVGPFAFTPEELFTLSFPEEAVRAEELTVMAWVLPQRAATKEDNRRERLRGAERGARSRLYGERFNVLLREHVVASLAEVGISAVAPQLSPHWKGEISPLYGRSSRWSERHAAHACGLGTFGLCDGLITSKGKAHRVGSVVLRRAVPPTPRPYAHHRAWCLFYVDGSCSACVRRCPAGAISEAGHDKERCDRHLEEICLPYAKEAWGIETYGCGLCQTGVPCESGIPKRVVL